MFTFRHRDNPIVVAITHYSFAATNLTILGEHHILLRKRYNNLRVRDDMIQQNKIGVSTDDRKLNGEFGLTYTISLWAYGWWRSLCQYC